MTDSWSCMAAHVALADSLGVQIKDFQQQLEAAPRAPPTPVAAAKPVAAPAPIAAPVPIDDDPPEPDFDA